MLTMPPCRQISPGSGARRGVRVGNCMTHIFATPNTVPDKHKWLHHQKMALNPNG